MEDQTRWRELTDIVAFGGAVVATVPVIIQAMRVMSNIRARNRLSSILSLNSPDQKKLKTMARAMHTANPDPEKVRKAQQFILVSAEKLVREQKQQVEQALAQPSLQGRANYIARILEKATVER